MNTDLINLISLKDELTNFIRYKLNSLDPKSRTTETSQTFNGDDSTTIFTPTNSSTLRYVKSVTVGGVPQTFGVDYTFTFVGTKRTESNQGSIIFTTPPPTGTDNISVTYGYGSTMVYPDYSRVDLGIEQYPRVSVGAFVVSLPGGQQGGSTHVIKNNIVVSVMIFAEDSITLDRMITTLRQEFIENAKSFYNFKYIVPQNIREINLSEDRTADVIGRNFDLSIPNKYEIISYE